MVILEEGKRRKRPLSIHYTTYNKPSTENGQDEETDSATRSAASNSAISAATLAVLPRLFRHTSGFLKWTSGKSKGKSYSQRNSEEMYDELSWINKIGAFFWHSRKSEQRKPFAVTVTPGQMKDFFCLLGKYILSFISLVLLKLYGKQSMIESNNSWMSKTNAKCTPIPTFWPWCSHTSCVQSLHRPNTTRTTFSLPCDKQFNIPLLCFFLKILYLFS